MVKAFSLPTFPSLLTAPHAPFIHRDLSWLQFNERVLTEARSKSNPLFEKLKFLAISSSNLDEFFMIRYPALTRSIQNANRADKQEALRLLQIRNDILQAVQRFVQKQAETLKSISHELKGAAVDLEAPSHNHPQSQVLGLQLFQREIFPQFSLLEPFTPSSINGLGNFQIGVIFEPPQNALWVKIPTSLPLLFSGKDEGSGKTFIYFLDHLLRTYLGTSLQQDLAPTLIRLTRDSDFQVNLEEEDTESIPDLVRHGLGSREKGRPTRIQYSGNPSKKLLSLLSKSLRLTSGQIIRIPSTLCLHGLSSVRHHISESILSRPGLTYPPLVSRIPRPFRDTSRIFERLDQEDLLLHHPYDSFDAFVSWIQTACDDPSVVQIEQTVYRMDAISPIIDALKKAAQTKEVRVIIELRARFDELNNLRLSEELKKAGVKVGFGFGKLKLHGKVALVTRIKDGKTRLYAHLSTGNYNATTARQYTDLAILTSHPVMCSDVRHFFDRVFAEQIPKDFKCLVPAPARLHRRLISHIQSEIDAAKKGKKARIVAKVNALVDDTVVQHLYCASQAGVQVDLIVRGACSLVPRVKGLSENIRVVSIVDRFLEHSRIYYFGAAKTIYLSSADWMPRNFFSRLELAFPVLDTNLYLYIEQVMIPTYLSDTAKATELTAEGQWKRRKPALLRKEFEIAQLQPGGKRPLRSQFFFRGDR